MRRYLPLIVATLAFLLFLSVHGTFQDRTGGEVRNALHVAALTDPLTMNPVFLRDAASEEVSTLLHASLIVTNPSTLDPEPRLFANWQQDNLTYIFTLHEDAVWSDGRPITSEDIAFTMRVVCHPDYTGLLYLPLSYIEGAEEYKKLHSSKFADRNISGIRAIDKKTLQVTLKESYAPFLSMLSFAPLPAHVLAHVEVGQMETHMYSRELPVSSGPYVLAEWKRAEYVHAKANLAYFLGKPNIDNIYYRIIPNAEVQLIELLAGKLDLIPTAVKVEDIAELQKNPEIKIYTNPRLVYDYIAINTNQEKTPLRDLQVRQALSMILDREEVVENILLGYADPLYGPLLPIHFAYDYLLETEREDEADARRRLVSAGYSSLEFDMIINAGNPVRENVAVLLQEKAAKAGIAINLHFLDWEAFLAALRDGDYDLAILGRGAEADPDLSYHWHSESRGNIYGYKNGEVDELLAKANSISDKAARAEIYRRVQQMIVNEIPVIWLYARKAVHAASSDLLNFLPHPSSVFYNVHEWDLDDGG